MFKITYYGSIFNKDDDRVTNVEGPTPEKVLKELSRRIKFEDSRVEITWLINANVPAEKRAYIRPNN